MAYGYFKDLIRTIASDKILRDKAFNVAKNPKYDGYQPGFFWWSIDVLIKKTSGRGIKNENIWNQRPLDFACVANISDRKISNRTPELAEELHKTTVAKFKKRKVHSGFTGNI